MNQKHLFKKLLVFTLLCALILLAGCNEKSPAPILPLTTDVIDLSHNGIQGNGFGNGPDDDEVKRWQTFIATSYPVVTAVEVKIKKYDSGSGTGIYTPVLVELYKTTADGKPTGERLAYGLINPDWINSTDFTVVRTGLSYNGLVAGKQYAIALTQGVLDGAHYEWLDQMTVNPDLHFGKYTEKGGWEEESNGDGWLKVYVASKITPPTRIFIYPTVKKTGNLKGLYADARTGADFIAAYRPLSLAGKTTHAFISISTTDCIANMPSQFGFPKNIPIVMVTDDTKIIADNWDDLLDGSIKMSLTEACGLSGIHGWWSGSNTDGTCDVSTTNCNGWTDSGSSTGMTGDTGSVGDSWIQAGFGYGYGPRYVFGIAY